MQKNESVLSVGKSISVPSKWLSGIWMQLEVKNILILSSLFKLFKNLVLPLRHESMAFLIIVDTRQIIFTSSVVFHLEGSLGRAINCLNTHLPFLIVY